MEITKAAIGGPAGGAGLESTGADGPAAAKATPQSKFLQVLGEASPGNGPADAKAARPPDAAVTPLPETMGIRRTIEAMLAAEQKIDALVNAARGGRTFSAGELLAMQSTVFRYSQTVEIVSRAADKLVGAVKQTLSTQV